MLILIMIILSIRQYRIKKYAVKLIVRTITFTSDFSILIDPGKYSFKVFLHV